MNIWVGFFLTVLYRIKTFNQDFPKKKAYITFNITIIIQKLNQNVIFKQSSKPLTKV